MIRRENKMEIKDKVLLALNDELDSTNEQIKDIKKTMLFLSHNDYKNKIALQRTLSKLEAAKRSILKQMYEVDRDVRFKDRELEAKITKYEAEANHLNDKEGLDKVNLIIEGIFGMKPEDTNDNVKDYDADE